MKHTLRLLLTALAICGVTFFAAVTPSGAQSSIQSSTHAIQAR